MAGKLEFRLRSVKCLDETGGTNFGSDEIAIAGVAVNPDASSAKIGELRVGSFNKGKTRAFAPPRRLALFDLRNGGDFPKSFAVTLVLAEKDHGGLAKLVNKLPKEITEHLEQVIKSKAASTVGATVGGGIGTIGGPVGIAIGAFVGSQALKVFGSLKGALGDDVFPPQTVDQMIKSADTKLGKDGVRETVVFKGHGGKYVVECDWRAV